MIHSIQLSSRPLVLISKSRRLSFKAKKSNCRFGILPDKSAFTPLPPHTTGLYKFKTYSYLSLKIFLILYIIYVYILRGANGILLVYDITNPKSFDNISKWLRNINEHASEDVERMLIGKFSGQDICEDFCNCMTCNYICI